MGAVILAAEDGPLGKQRQSADGSGTAGPHGGIGDDLVEEGQVDGVVVAVESHRTDIDGGMDQLR